MFVRNENEALRDISTMRSIDCTVCYADIFFLLHKTVLKVESFENDMI